MRVLPKHSLLSVIGLSRVPLFMEVDVALYLRISIVIAECMEAVGEWDDR